MEMIALDQPSGCMGAAEDVETMKIKEDHGLCGLDFPRCHSVDHLMYSN